MDDLFENQRLLPRQLSVYGYARLNDDHKKIAGISDLTFDQNGILWALSTIPNVAGENQTGGLFRINRFADGKLEAVHIFSFPGLQPEGLCHQDDKKFMIIFDNDNAIPVFCIVNMEEL